MAKRREVKTIALASSGGRTVGTPTNSKDSDFLRLLRSYPLQWIGAFIAVVFVFSSFAPHTASNQSEPQFTSIVLIACTVGGLSGLFTFTKRKTRGKEEQLPWPNILLALAGVATGLIIEQTMYETPAVKQTGDTVRALTIEPVTITTVLLGLACAALCAWIFRELKRRLPQRVTQTLPLVILLIVFCVQAASLVYDTASPKGDAYATFHVQDFSETRYDGYFYAQTLNNVERGMPYYQALDAARSADTAYSESSPLRGYFSVRQPLLTSLLAVLLGNGLVAAYIWFLVFSLIVALGAYLFLATFAQPPVAATGSLVIAQYFLSVASIFPTRFD
ncbi:MAG: hypothetical protein LBJ07_00100 [Actinomycetes bacterium]|jgi:protein-S-isoprenylcysteine O-methyltransferase Ste14|nr:hypothetical protein [Actinomycetes bacterium]